MFPPDVERFYLKKQNKQFKVKKHYYFNETSNMNICWTLQQQQQNIQAYGKFHCAQNLFPSKRLHFICVGVALCGDGQRSCERRAVWRVTTKCHAALLWWVLGLSKCVQKYLFSVKSNGRTTEVAVQAFSAAVEHNNKESSISRVKVKATAF